MKCHDETTAEAVNDICVGLRQHRYNLKLLEQPKGVNLINIYGIAVVLFLETLLFFDDLHGMVASDFK